VRTTTVTDFWTRSHVPTESIARLIPATPKWVVSTLRQISSVMTAILARKAFVTPRRGALLVS